MAYKALYRSYRPNTFSSVIGQEHIIQTLKNALSNDKTSHAYIFSGPRGIGKTTIARILAKAINCEDLQNGEPCNKCAACKMINNSETPDIVEFDAASNNGVEEIRNVLEKVNFLPSVLKHKVYIIDEVHMLSISAFNALLKTLEEPPAHVMFILATTEVHKIPATILSRCQRFDFKPLTVKEIKQNLKAISEKEKIDIEEEALNLVAEASDGGMRDAIGILDQVNAYSTKTISVEDVNNVTGRISNQKLVELMQAIKDNNSIKAVEITNELMAMGKEVSRLVQSLLQLCRDILLYQNTAGEVDGKLIYDDMAFKMLCNALNKRKIFYYIDVLSDVQNKIKFSLSQKIFLEVGIMKMATATNEDYGGVVSVAGEVSGDVEDRISSLESQLNKVKSELVHLNLAEFKNETKEKLHELEDASKNEFISAVPSDVIERIEALENKLKELNISNGNHLQEEINFIKEQLQANNNVDEDDLTDKVNNLEAELTLINEKMEEINTAPYDSSNEEWIKIEDSIKLVTNQMDEITLRMQELEDKRVNGPTLFDFDGGETDELVRLRAEVDEIKATQARIEESLNELIIPSEEPFIQKRENPYEQKVQDIVEQIKESTEEDIYQEEFEETTEELLVEPEVVEAEEEAIEESAEEDIYQEEFEETTEELLVEPETVDDTEELFPVQEEESILELFPESAEDIYVEEPSEEEMLPDQEETENNEEVVIEELIEPVQDEIVEAPTQEETPKPVQFNLYDLYEESKPAAKEETPVVEVPEVKEEPVPVAAPEVDKIPDINDFPDERPVELHYELTCDVAKLERDLHTMNLSDEVPLDVLNRVVANMVGMKEDIVLFTKDKVAGVYDEKPSLEADAKRNIKTFLIMLSSRDASGAATKDKETAGLIAEVKELIKDYRNASKAQAYTAPVFVMPEVKEPEPVEEPKVVEETPIVVEPVVTEPEVIEEPVEVTSEPIQEEVVKTPIVEEAKPVEEPKPNYVRATVLETKPKHVEKVVVEEDNPYAIEKIEAVMHDSRSEISREERKIILNNWRKLGDRVGTALSPVARFLMDGQPVVNGNNCIIITYPNAALCNHIMGEKVRFEAKQILKITFGREYDFIALPEDIWQDKRNEYRGQYQMGSRYPKLSPINNPELKIIKNSFVDEKSDEYNKAVDLFGENLIKEEEE